MPMPSKYKPEFVEQARVMCELGATDAHLAKAFDVSESTLNEWKLKHPEFIAALDAGKADADVQVVQSLYKQALGFTHDGRYYPPVPVAAIFWLKNRLPDEWRDVKAVEHSGSVAHRHSTELTEDELVNIAAGSSKGTAQKASRAH